MTTSLSWLSQRATPLSTYMELASGSSVTLTSTTLELTQASTNQKVGLRFADIDLPQGAVIQNAWIQFTANSANSEVTNLTIQAEASDNALTFAASANNISSRTKTTASVSWAPASWNAADEGGPDQRTPNLAAVSLASRESGANAPQLVIETLP